MLDRFRTSIFWRLFLPVAAVVAILLVANFIRSNSSVANDFVRYSNSTNWMRGESYSAVVDQTEWNRGQTVFRAISGTLALVYQDPTGQVWAIVNTDLPTAVVDGNQVLQGEPLVAAIQLTSLWEFEFPDDMAVWLDDGSITRKGRFLSGRIILENP